MRNRIIVAVDGPAGSGKSSVSKEVAIQTGIKYIDSGAIYRSITWYFLENYDNFDPDFDFKKDLPRIDIEQKFLNNGKSLTFVNGIDVSDLIRNETIAENIGIISDNVDIRNFVNNILRKWAEEESIIMDGRDIGTVVFPNADLKLYLDASVDIRAWRRAKEYQEMGKEVDENSIKKQIIHRDNQDKSRPFGALKKADDANYLDTSNMNKQEVIDRIKEMINVSLEN